MGTRKQSEMPIADQTASRQVIAVDQTTPELPANQDHQHRRLHRALAQHQHFKQRIVLAESPWEQPSNINGLQADDGEQKAQSQDKQSMEWD